MKLYTSPIDSLLPHPAMLIVVLILLMYSCLNEEVCEDVATVPVRIGFYQMEAEEEDPQVLAIDSLTVFGVGNDSIIYQNRFNVSRIELPLNSAIDSCAFVFVLPSHEPGLLPAADTVWFHYRILPNLISMECGFVSFYELNTVTHTRYNIDSLSIETPSITNTQDEHIKIFPFAPADDR